MTPWRLRWPAIYLLKTYRPYSSAAPARGRAASAEMSPWRMVGAGSTAVCRQALGPRGGIERHRESITRYGGRSQATRDFRRMVRELWADARRTIELV